MESLTPVEVRMVQNGSRGTAADVPNLESADEEARGNAVRGLCPCHAGWEVFEGHVSDVLRMLKDPSRVVRAHALHVWEDAARMQLAADLSYYLEAGEVRIGRTGHFPSIVERLNARRRRKARRHKRHRGITTRWNGAESD
jgi:hypothetical protein